jgi:hypothetical protein
VRRDATTLFDTQIVFASVLGAIFQNEGQLISNGMVAAATSKKYYRREFNYGFNRR